ncbi:MAG TPA: phosphotransferase family protein [Stellaceae bacterium]|nr:phosphotransferase family protein [Stellaceae bacterium]
MAVTASPRSEPPRHAALARFLAAASGAKAVAITALAPLAGGAIQDNWRLDAQFSDGALAGAHSLVLRRPGPARFCESLSPIAEFAVLKAAFAAGVSVPEPLFASRDEAVCGAPFLIMRRVAGSAAPARMTGGEARPALAERLGRELARLHQIRPPRRDLAALPSYHDPARRIALFRAVLDRRPEPRPALEWGMRRLETHLPAPVAPALCHRDFRTGNYLAADDALAAILDWEFAGWGDPDEDIGWFCCKAWRFARLDREAGGIAARRHFYRGYEREAERRIDPERVRFWEVFANVRWAVIALQQSDRYILGGERHLDLALTGRRAGESEFEILRLLDPAPSARGQIAPREGRIDDAPREPRAMQDLPSGPELLALARAVLNAELTPLLPPERREEARLVAAAMAIAEREAAAADEPFAAVLRELAGFYGADFGASDLLRRFAGDLRRGAFEASPARERAARDLLWRLAAARLRRSNPHFLAAHGFA